MIEADTIVNSERYIKERYILKHLKYFWFMEKRSKETEDYQ